MKGASTVSSRSRGPGKPGKLPGEQDRARNSLGNRLRRRHSEALRESWRQLMDNKLSNLLTIAMLTIGLLLPSLMLRASSGLEGLVETLQRDAGATAYLHSRITEEELQALAEAVLANFPGSTVLVQSADEARDQFAEQSGLGDLLARLSDNPVPPTLSVKPATPADMRRVSTYLQGIDAVDTVSADLRWLQRLQTAALVLRRATWLLGALLAAGVLVLVAGSVAASVDRQGARIEVMKLVGATDAHVLRPFLYKGVSYGLAAGVLAFLALTLLQLLLGPLAGELRAQFALPPADSWPAGSWLLGLSLAGGLLGWSAALAAGWRRIRRHEPGRAVDPAAA